MQTEKRRKKYQVFTPIDTVNKMLDEIGYLGGAILDKTIVDISCGDGAFLVEALRRFIKACKDSHIEDLKIPSLAIKNIFGCENDKSYYHKCQQNMSDLLNKELRTNKHYRFKNIKLMDGLTVNDVCFDFVVGNPPYLSYKEMNKIQREYLQENFETCKERKFDYSYAFVEKSISLLKDDGIACMITPINMYKIRSGRLMRDFLRTKLYKLIDVTEDNIFHGVLTNPIISLFKTEHSEKVVLVKNDVSKTIDLNDFYIEDKMGLPIENEKKRFGDFFTVHNGVATLMNSAFLVPKGTVAVERSILKNAYSPKDIRYKSNNMIIFPYKVKNGLIEKYTEDEFISLFPKAYSYMLPNKKRLEDRDRDVGAKWFEYGRSQALLTILNEKIMVPAIMTKNMKPVRLSKNDIVYAGFFIIAKDPNNHPLSEAQSILSNESLFHYIERVGVKMNGKTYRYSVKDLENYRY